MSYVHGETLGGSGTHQRRESEEVNHERRRGGGRILCIRGGGGWRHCRQKVVTLNVPIPSMAPRNPLPRGKLAIQSAAG